MMRPLNRMTGAELQRECGRLRQRISELEAALEAAGRLCEDMDHAASTGDHNNLNVFIRKWRKIEKDKAAVRAATKKERA